MIWELLPNEIKASYKKHLIAAIAVQGSSIKVRLLWDRSWQEWRYINLRWQRYEVNKGA
jgi:hypothetical protein